MSCWNRCGLKVRRGYYSLTMRLLITGGLGFVGGRLAVYLTQAGHQIVLGSRNALNSPAWLPQAGLAQIVWDDDGALERSCNGVDVVIHAAGALAFNGVATARLVAAASRARVPRFIYLSTAHVYASPLEGTITEEICPRNLHPYATSHLAGEHAVLSANLREQIQGIVLRLSNTFGAPVHSDVNCWMLLVNDLCRQAVETHKLILHTHGLQQRDFINMVGVCRVIEQLSISNDNSLSSGLFNVGAGASQSVLDMAQVIQKRCKQVLGFEPELCIPKNGASESHHLLHYRSDRLTAMASDTHANMTEIDNLLRFCHSTFTQTECTNA